MDEGVGILSTLDGLIGQDLAVAVLKASLESGRIAHAYLFRGPDGTGKATAARLFASYLLCLAVSDGSSRDPCGRCPSCRLFMSGSHPDLFHSGSEEGAIGIEHSHKMIEDSMKKPFLARRKVFIIENAENMTREASNAMLKVLEEPAVSSCFVLTTSNAASVPETILSRCQLVPFRALRVADIVEIILRHQNVDRERAVEAAVFAAGSVARALFLLDFVDGAAQTPIALERIERESPVILAETFSRMDTVVQGRVLDALAINLEKLLWDAIEAGETPDESQDRAEIYRRCLLSVVGARRDLERNVSPFLVFVTLCLNMRRLLARAKELA